MKNVVLIYFDSCPNVQLAKKLLDELGLSYSEVNQDKISKDHKYAYYSSPTVLIDDEILFGSKTQGGGCSFKIPSIEELRKRIPLFDKFIG